MKNLVFFIILIAICVNLKKNDIKKVEIFDKIEVVFYYQDIIEKEVNFDNFGFYHKIIEENFSNIAFVLIFSNSICLINNNKCIIIEDYRKDNYNYYTFIDENFQKKYFFGTFLAEFILFSNVFFAIYYYGFLSKSFYIFFYLIYISDFEIPYSLFFTF